jgi:hypothetical protein
MVKKGVNSKQSAYTRDVSADKVGGQIDSE